MKRMLAATALTAALTALGTPAVHAAPNRDAVTEHVRAWEKAYNDVDTNKIGDLTCDKYRDRETANNESRIPTWDDFVKPRDLYAKFPKLTQETLDQLLDAAKRKDAAAFRQASVQVVRENAHLTVTNIDKINVIEAKNATVTVTTSSVWGNDSPKTTTSDWYLTYERDAWRYCNPVITVR
ncbi:Uncharacterised protein [Mycobacteroides abscessus subsp. bolletii]|uniref:Secreted protein n=1 Tax=Mycobacteroides abscessus subsp. bolletii TaxID=319705 RepID=A0A9Q7WI82_9MYCO|nr:hypothetical protein [Mycobacteroides abscessus]SHU28488.1 Uncharacterised protein [Mycobacteroides abscessus subsp. bolletii]SHV26253.1 Uncharacterised protein [Mycobacteroides abscessus subsp. bolletii]SHX18398.1 Uncharacterised protein [Mycobacteroides abscessus subsp. bolletii]SKG52840.1 Uncharacterised protein [Mycobacteroides abscessus subsp. bolletii]SKG64270.1 Uncharacterised protein [Mycobacteroides abscessus subsp. bolletii]